MDEAPGCTVPGLGPRLHSGGFSFRAIPAPTMRSSSPQSHTANRVDWLCSRPCGSMRDAASQTRNSAIGRLLDNRNPATVRAAGFKTIMVYRVGPAPHDPRPRCLHNAAVPLERLGLVPLCPSKMHAMRQHRLGPSMVELARGDQFRLGGRQASHSLGRRCSFGLHLFIRNFTEPEPSPVSEVGIGCR